MAKNENRRMSQEPTRAQPNQRLPKDHFAPDGLSEGKQTGPVRKEWDAYQGKRTEGEDK